jgi:hypothetical protein
MAGQHASGQLVPILLAPAEFVNKWSERECTIGTTAGNDHISFGRQRCDNRPCPEIGVGGEDRLVGEIDTLFVGPSSHGLGVQPGQQIVALYHGDPE